MNKIKSSIPKTAICIQLNNHRLNIGTSIYDQMDSDLQCYGLDMIAIKVNNATFRSIYQICIRDIIEQI